MTLADKYEGKRLNSPNDIVVKSDGSIYFTDSRYGIERYAWFYGSGPNMGEPGEPELAFQGVYRLSPDGSILTLLVRDFDEPNGLAFSPDEKILYISDTNMQHIRAFDVNPDGTLANGRVFTGMTGEWYDGIKVDMNGNLYVATNTTHGVRVFDSAGKSLGMITTPELADNRAFGGPDNKTLFIMARTSVYRVRLKVPGIKIMGQVRPMKREEPVSLVQIHGTGHRCLSPF